MGYKRIAIKSVSWVTAFRFFYRGIAFVRMAVLARLLTPNQFGEFGIAALVLGLVEIFTETGINVFLVQQKDHDTLAKYLDTAWIISIFRGLIITAIVVLASFPVSRFFNAPSAAILILLMAFVPLLRGFINPAIAQFQKNLRFDQEFLLRTGIAVTDAVFAVVLALLYRHPVSLVGGLIAGALIEVIISQIIVKPKPALVFNRTQARHIIGEGKWVTAAGIFSYFANRGVDASIGRLINTNALGIYNMAYKASVMIIDELVEMVNRVAFPVYTRIAGDTSRLTRAFLKTHVIFSIAAIGVMSLVYVFSDTIVSILLGPDWLAVIPHLRSLSLVGMIIGVAAPTNPLFLAVKKQNYLTAAVVAQLVSFIAFMLFSEGMPGLENIITIFGASIAASIPIRWGLAYKILSGGNRQTA